MKTEYSAGAVIVKMVQGTWHVLCIRDMNKNLTFPKGLIEPKEDARDAAIREAEEETGISNIVYKAPLPEVAYFYTRNGATLHKTVSYFLFTYEGTEKLKPQIEEGITDILWLPLEQATDSIGYTKSNLPLLTETKRLLSV